LVQRSIQNARHSRRRHARLGCKRAGAKSTNALAHAEEAPYAAQESLKLLRAE
jgi:hypothetical protein